MRGCSTASGVSTLLETDDEEGGDGMQHRAHRRELLTTPVVVERLTAGDVYVGDAYSSKNAIAATPVCIGTLHAETLQTLLRWFTHSRMPSSNARALYQASHVRLVQQLRTAIEAARDRASYTDVIETFSHAIRMLPLAVTRARATLVTDVEQAQKDLTREASIILNGVRYALGTKEALREFLADLLVVVDEEMGSQLCKYHPLGGHSPGATSSSSGHVSKEGGASVADITGAATSRLRARTFSAGSSTTIFRQLDDAEARAARRPLRDGRTDALQSWRKHAVSAVVCDVLVASCRTMTGGDSFTQCLELFGQHDMVTIAAETSTMSPAVITIHVRTQDTALDPPPIVVLLPYACLPPIPSRVLIPF